MFQVACDVLHSTVAASSDGEEQRSVVAAFPATGFRCLYMEGIGGVLP